MNRKGLSHIEFVVSFVIFIGFIVFAFVFFNPLSSQRTLKSTMDYAWIEVSQEGKEKVETYSVSIDPINNPLNTDLKIRINNVPLNYNASVEDVDGVPINTHRDSTGIVYFSRASINDMFFRIRYSPSLTDSIAPLPSATELTNNYAISSSQVEDFYFESLFLELNNSYYSNYSELKEELNLPNRMDFGFIVTFGNSEIRAVNEIPSGIEVLSKNDRVEVIRNSGRHEYGEVTVLVW